MSAELDFTVGQIGARIILRILKRDPISRLLQPRNLVGATTFDIVVLRPDDTKQTFLSSGGAVIFTPAPDGEGDGSDGLIEAVTTLDTDLPIEGDYKTQAFIVIPGETGFTQNGLFKVGKNL